MVGFGYWPKPGQLKKTGMGVLDELRQKINNAPKEEREKHIAEAGIGLGKQEAINQIREACKKLKFKGDKYLTSALRRKDEESTRRNV